MLACSTPGPDHLRTTAAAPALARDARGSALVEFAMLAGPVIALLLGIIQTSLLFFVQQALETASEDAARRLMTGEVQRSSIAQSRFKRDVCATLLPMMSCDNLHVDVTTANSFSEASANNQAMSYSQAGATNTWRFNTGGPGSIIVARVYYEWPVFVGPAGLDYATMPNGKRMLVATSFTKTETYQ